MRILYKTPTGAMVQIGSKTLWLSDVNVAFAQAIEELFNKKVEK